MRKRGTARLILALAMAGVLAFTSTAAYAEEAIETECAQSYTIEGCAANIKSVYKERYPEQTEIIDEIVDLLSASDEFVGIFEYEGARAFQIVEDSLTDVLDPEPMPLMQTDDLYVSKYSFPKVKQINSYYCGPASAVMALIGSGVSGYNYTLDTDITNKWQRELAVELQTEENGGTTMVDMDRVLSEKIPGAYGYNYKGKAFLPYAHNKIIDFIEVSLVMDAVPIIRIQGYNLLWYTNMKIDHFLVIYSVDFNSNYITLVDPYDVKGKSTFGLHTITFDEFNDMVESCSDYIFWAFGYTKWRDGYYVYN